jgi:hypothetical protein
VFLYAIKDVCGISCSAHTNSGPIRDYFSTDCEERRSRTPVLTAGWRRIIALSSGVLLRRVLSLGDRLAV